jgi:hypothetical protein
MDRPDRSERAISIVGTFEKKPLSSRGGMAAVRLIFRAADRSVIDKKPFFAFHMVGAGVCVPCGSTVSPTVTTGSSSSLKPVIRLLHLFAARPILFADCNARHLTLSSLREASSVAASSRRVSSAGIPP